MVSFKNTLVLLTSNIGSRVIAASTGGGLAVFGSQRSLMGGGDEADEAMIASEQVGELVSLGLTGWGWVTIL